MGKDNSFKWGTKEGDILHKFADFSPCTQSTQFKWYIEETEVGTGVRTFLWFPCPCTSTWNCCLESQHSSLGKTSESVVSRSKSLITFNQAAGEMMLRCGRLHNPWCQVMQVCSPAGSSIYIILKKDGMHACMGGITNSIRPVSQTQYINGIYMKWLPSL